MQGSNVIKSTQFALIVFITQTGIGVITLPALLAKETGHDGWISLLITFFVIIILSMLINLLMSRYSDKAIYDINKFIFGKIAGTGFNGLLVFYLLFSSVVSNSIVVYFMKMTILPNTPQLVLSAFISLPSFYLVWQGLKLMGRFEYLSAINYFLILLFIFLLYKEFRFSFLLPVGEAGLLRTLKGIRPCFFAFLGFELVSFFYPYISDRKNVLKGYILASFASLLFFLIIFIVCIIVFGENLLTTLFLPFFNLSRIYNAPILERIDLYLIALWYMPMICSVKSYIIATFDGFQKTFGIKKTKIFYVIFFIAIQVLSILPKDIDQVKMLVDILNLAGMGVAMFLVLCLFLSFVRRKGVCVR